MKPYNKAKSSKGEEIREMFNSIAPAYDKLNHILSFQIDKLWRRRVVKIVEQSCRKSGTTPTILDLATGTADLAIAIAKQLPQATLLGVDPSEGMLSVAQEKLLKEGLQQRVTLECQSAESLSLDSESFDVVTAAFGVRNFSDLEGGLSEMVRVTRCGGRVIVLEFSTPPNPLFRYLYNIYSRNILPRIGAILSRDRKAYEYLPASVEEFASPSQFIRFMERAGLENCVARSQSFGIAQIYIGDKKSSSLPKNRLDNIK